jgi:glycogen(starch) synthase
MRILFISDLYPPHVKGGYELRCEETVNEIAHRGHNVYVLTSKWNNFEQPIEVNIFRKLTLSPFKDLHLPRFLPDIFHLNKRINQIVWGVQGHHNYNITFDLLGQLKPDIVFIWNMEHLGLTPVLAAQERGIPVVYDLGAYWLLTLKKELDLETSPIKKKYREAINGLRDFSDLDMRYLITNSNVLKKLYIEKGFPEHSITVIPRGVPSSMILKEKGPRAPNQIPKKEIRLLFAGRLTDDKAPDAAIKAVRCLLDQYGLNNIDLDIVGTGSKDYINELKKLVKELQLEQNVEFLGWFEHRKLVELYSTYSVLLFPSRWVEPFGGTILEAMARGLPVIATNTGGIPELIEDKVNGMLVPVDQPAIIARAVNQLIDNRDLWSRVRRAGLKTIQEKYTLERVTDQILEYLNVVIDNQRSLSKKKLGKITLERVDHVIRN